LASWWVGSELSFNASAHENGEFQFANKRERDDNAITELSNPLSPRRAIN